jgi:hypothetical protein
MAKEIRIPHSKIQNPQTITKAMEEEFRARGLNLHVHEVERMDDDHDKGERILQVRNTKYFF